jgi:hypothetical protein
VSRAAACARHCNFVEGAREGSKFFSNRSEGAKNARAPAQECWRRGGANAQHCDAQCWY